jgi:hypothetical protein
MVVSYRRKLDAFSAVKQNLLSVADDLREVSATAVWRVPIMPVTEACQTGRGQKDSGPSQQQQQSTGNMFLHAAGNFTSRMTGYCI